MQIYGKIETSRILHTACACKNAHTMTYTFPSQLFNYTDESIKDTKPPNVSQNVHCNEQHLFFKDHYNLLSACQLNRIRNSGGKLTSIANRALKHLHGNSSWDKKAEAENSTNNKRNWFYMAFFREKCQLASKINKARYIFIIVLIVVCEDWLWVLSVILISFTIQ